MTKHGHVLELGVMEVNGTSANLQQAGQAKSDQGLLLVLYADRQNAEPIVHCPATGKRFRLRWQDIIEIALNQGVCLPASKRN